MTMWNLHATGICCERCGQATGRPSRVCDDCRMLIAIASRATDATAQSYQDLRAWAEEEIGDAVIKHCLLLVLDPEGVVTTAERQALRKQRDKVLRLLRRDVPVTGL
jgi:hypothetical protein